MARVSRLQRWWLDWWPHRVHIRRYVPRLLKACPEPFRGQVLEVGSGSGWTSRRILETFPQVELTATDVDGHAWRGFEALRDRYGRRLTFQQADLLSLPFDRASFDIVLAIHVLHRIDDQRTAIRQFLRVLRAGGLIGIGGVRPKVGMLEHLLQEEGAKVLRSRGGMHYYIWARKPYTEGS